MKKLAVIILALAALAQVVSAAEFTGTFAAAKARSAEISKPILVDFFTEW